MPRRLRDITYEIPQSNMGIYNPIEYKPQAPDLALLNNRLDRLDLLREKANQQKSAVDMALGKIEVELHNDPETQKWFSDYKNNVKGQINDAIKTGDYAGAINMATSLAGEISSDSSVLGRIRANQEYQTRADETHKRAVEGKISADTERWWLANNQFKYEDVTDDNGNIVGGTSYSTLQTPVDDIN